MNITGLIGKDVFNDFELTTKHPGTIAEADAIRKKLSLGNRKLDIKRDFIVNLIVNFKISRITNGYLVIPRGNDVYTKLVNDYVPDYQRIKIVKKVLDELVDKGFIYCRGYIKRGQTSGYDTTSLDMYSAFVRLPFSEITTIKPKTFIHLREKVKGKNIDKEFTPTATTIKLDNDLKLYSTVRENNKITLEGVTKGELQLYNEILRRYAIDNLQTIKPINSLFKINLRTTYLVRIFNETLTQSGRFYRGLESNIANELRKNICINGNQTVELDYSAHHIRMLYHLRNINIKTDPYDVEPNKPGMREIYKAIFLRCINTKDRKSGLLSIWKYFNENPEVFKLIPDNSKKTRDALIDNLQNHNPLIKGDFFTQKCFDLMYKDSEISHNILMHFAKKGILALCVHDSFLVEQQHKQELEDLMISEYKKMFKFDPIIK